MIMKEARGTGFVARRREIRYAYHIFIRKYEGQRSLGRPRCG
jgi:hypothetical protein